MKFTRTVLAVSALALSLSAYAADITGKWTGKMSMDMSALKAQFAAQAGNLKPEQKKMVEQQMAMASTMLAAMRMNVDFQKGGKYTMTTTGTPGSQKAESETGTWTIKGNQVSMTGSKSGKGPRTVVGTLSSNGKTITVDLTKEAKAQAAKSGAAKDTKVPPLTIVFTKN